MQNFANFVLAPFSQNIGKQSLLLTPTISAISTADFLCLYNSTAVSALGLITFFTPPILLLVLAAESPALVRSRMVSLSNSANEPKMLNKKRH